MAKKKTTDMTEGEILTNQTEPIVIEETPQAVESVVNSTQLKPGYVMIEHRVKSGTPIIVNATQFGTTYPEADWQLVAEKKS